MSTIEQLSIFLENRTGRLAEIAQILTDDKVVFRTLELVEAGDFGIMRVIVDEPKKVKQQLGIQGIIATISTVFAVEITDRSDCFNRMVQILSAAQIDVAYTYMAPHGTHGAYVVKIDSSNLSNAIKRLEGEGIKILDAL